MMDMSDQQAFINDTFSGSNVIRINQATMQQAIEYWLNNVILRKPIAVTNVKEYPNELVFEISVTEALTGTQP